MSSTRTRVALTAVVTVLVSLIGVTPAQADPPMPSMTEPYVYPNSHSRLCLEIENGSTANFGRATQNRCVNGRDTNQAWKIEWFGQGAVLINQHSGKCLEVSDWRTDDFAPVAQYDCHREANQQWRLTWEPSAGAWSLTNVHSGKCLEVRDWRTDGGAPVNQYTCHRGRNQLWSGFFA